MNYRYLNEKDLNSIRIDDFYAFMRERENIRIKKEAGLSKPWTDNPILMNWRFTNVKREHDKTTLQLNEFFYTKHLDSRPEEKLLNCALFRYFGKFETALAFGWQEYYNPAHLHQVVDRIKAEGKTVFTSAYVITNQGISDKKENVVIDIFMKQLVNNAKQILEVLFTTYSWEAVARVMGRIQGFGGTGFMTKEVLLDTILCGLWLNPNTGSTHPVDYNTWSPVGPGARQGAAYLLGTPGVVQSEGRALEVMKYIFNNDRGRWPNEYPPLVLTDIQFQMCEFAKYEKIKNGGRGKRKYSGQ